ncbi:MAG TPA: RodZ domain-containing protein [Candidatus Saccharimonadia bacterium]|nr:RodZ domain-containing protein [Candidatus Saccharimonadia bacterium]
MPQDAELKPNIPVGQQLKARRQALRLSLAQVEVQTKIRGKFLTALESGDYSSLPNDIYSRGFVQHYASHLGLNGAAIAAAYAAERGGITAGRTKRPQLQQSRRLVFTGPIVAALSAVIIIVAILGYLLWQFSALAAPPQLTITTPSADTTITGGVIDLSGKTTPGADVTINDSPVLTDTDGSFSEKVALEDGINAIRITATSKLGKSTSVTRNILAHLPKVDSAAATVPAATFDGIAIAVSVRETTSMVVVVDGVERFRGTFVAGRSYLFTGTATIDITTGNAGATSLIITNSTVASKKIDALGRSGEIRRNQAFAKDTVFP